MLHELLRHLADHLWQSTAVLAAAWLLTRAMRGTHARARHRVLLAASLKFLVPFALLTSLGSQTSKVVAPTAAPLRVPLAAGQLATPFTIEPIVSVQPDQPWLPTALAALWLAGFLFVILRALTRYLRVRRTLHSARELHYPQLPGLRVVSSAARLEPGLFGIFRPTLWLPEGIAARLSPHELDAILAHELCHALHHDNLAALLHMLVEALFWLHPAVWWLGAQLLKEREQACDEHVVHSTIHPEAYAEGILKVCEYYVSQPLPCAAAITGADLRHRIESIVTTRRLRDLSPWKKVALSALLAVTLTAPVLLGVLHAQATPRLEFEVASIKPVGGDPIRAALDSGGEARLGTQIHGTTVEYPFVTLRHLISYAYGIRGPQISGPSWMADQYFHIVAKMPSGSRKEDLAPMLQALLAERFKLVAHREDRPQDVLALVLAPGGPKLTPSSDDKPWNPGTPTSPGERAILTDGTVSMRIIPDSATATVHFYFHRLTMTYLAGWLNKTTLRGNRYVIDGTGIKGTYDVALDCPNIALGLQPPPAAPGSAPADTASAPAGDDLLGSLRRLGLTLEKRRAPLTYIVVDHLDRTPTAN
jgi:uncharacterized protein (TIGR03435 family)